MHVAYEITVTVYFLLVFLYKFCVFLECTLTRAHDAVSGVPPREEKVLEAISCRDPIP